MPQFPLRSAAAAAVLAAAAAASASLQSASVTRLAIGTSTVVGGTEIARPVKAWLELGKRRIPLRVARGATDSGFTAKLASHPASAHGPCLLRVRGRGSRIPFTLAGFTIELPATASAAPERAGAGDEITIDGEYFGTRKGRVLVGSKAARIVSWSETRIRVRIPASAAPGLAFVEVLNRAGASGTKPVISVL